MSRIAQILHQQPNLHLDIVADDIEGEPSRDFTQRRIQTTQNYLLENLKVLANRIAVINAKVVARRTIELKIVKKGEI